MTRCRNTPPQNPPKTSAKVYGSAAFANASAARHHANPSATRSAPMRLSGRWRQAYRPVPTKLQMTIGPHTAHARSASARSLPRTSATTPAPHRAATSTTTRVRVAVMARPSQRDAHARNPASGRAGPEGSAFLRRTRSGSVAVRPSDQRVDVLDRIGDVRADDDPRRPPPLIGGAPSDEDADIGVAATGGLERRREVHRARDRRGGEADRHRLVHVHPRRDLHDGGGPPQQPPLGAGLAQQAGGQL